MKRIISFILIGTLAIALFGCTAQPPAESPSQTQPQTPTQPPGAQVTSPADPERTPLPYLEGTPDPEAMHISTNLGIKLIRELAEGGKNVVISPLSITMALQLVLNGADDTARAAMQSVFGTGLLPSMMNEENSKLLRALLEPEIPQGTDETALTKLAIANGVFTQLAPSQAFIDTATNYYHALPYQVDFASNDARDKVNAFIKEHTQGLIENPVDSFDENAVMAIVNALYFDGQWESAFRASNTRKDSFVGTQDTTDVDFMLQTTEFDYAVMDGYQAVRLPYKDGYSMLVFLPNAGIAPETVIEGLSAAMINSLTETMEKRDVRLLLPKFKLDTKFSLEDAFTALGMGECFEGGSGDFNALLENPAERVFIGNILNASHIDVNEKGTRAASATVVEMETTSLEIPSQQPIDFEVNRPFALCLVHDSTGVTLMLGIVNNL